MSLFVIIMVAVSLSMDAFSLALAYGTLGMERKEMRKLSIIVGLYHFFMPLLGMLIGSKVLEIINVNPNWILLFILTFIGIQMIIESFKKDKVVKSMGFIDLLLFGFAVSIDSFSVGIGLTALTTNYLLAVVFFSVFSFSFTYIGLIIGKKINSVIGNIATFIGGTLLILIGILYIL